MLFHSNRDFNPEGPATMRRFLLLPALLLIAATALGADVEYSTTGAMDTPATHAGDRDGWGTEFIARWDNATGSDVHLDELAWPCGGWWAQFWYVWVTDTRPANPYTLEYYGTFVATIDDDTQYPPSAFTYIDVSGRDIVIPAGGSMYFGYSNPGLAGQVAYTGTSTWSWLDDQWDRDGDFGRTTVMQFKGSFQATPVGDGALPTALALGSFPNPFNPVTTIDFALPRAMDVELAIYSPRGHLVRNLIRGERNAGTHRIVWDGTDPAGRAVPSGLYLARLVTADGSVTHKLVVAK